MPKAVRASTNRYEMIKLAYERTLSPDDLTKCYYKKYHLFGGQHNSGGTLIFLRCVNCRKKVRKTNHGDHLYSVCADYKEYHNVGYTTPYNQIPCCGQCNNSLKYTTAKKAVLYENNITLDDEQNIVANKIRMWLGICKKENQILYENVSEQDWDFFDSYSKYIDSMMHIRVNTYKENSKI